MEDTHEAVRERYRRTAQGSGCCGGGSASEDASQPSGSCCGGSSTPASARFGYTLGELRMIPDGADLGLGCGNPTALAGLTEGEVVVDLGSGGGIDCFLAAARVGDSGRVIGVDMTAEMIERARRVAENGGFENVEFRLGEIEHLPIADNTADVIISNCVINLSPDKDRVLAEAARVLRSGGRLMVSDLVLQTRLRADLHENVSLLTGCVAGALLKDDFLAALERAGFVDVVVEQEKEYVAEDNLAAFAHDTGVPETDAGEIAANVRSVSVRARKP